MGIATEIIIAMIIGFGMVLGLFGFYSGLSENYNVAAGNYTNSSDYAFVTQINSSLTSKLDTLQDKALKLGEKAQTGSLLEAVIAGANILVDTGSVLVEIPSILITFITGMQRLSGIFIPNWFIVTITLTLITIFIFKVLELALKRDI